MHTPTILNNPILSTDSYKFSHYKQYPKNTTDNFSYVEARGSSIPGIKEVVMFNLQTYIRSRLLSPVTMAHVNQAEIFCRAHGVPFNREGWEIIVKDHNGFMPVTIRSVPEGTPIPLGNLLVSIRANDERLWWLPSYLETDILRHVWYGSSVATVSRECKRMIRDYLIESSDAPEQELPFKLHDFGFRGVSSFESAGAGGAAHLINFSGTDTVAGILHAMEYYDADVCGFSIPAAEHSTITSWGREHEQDAYQNMVDQYAYNGGLFAVVSDSYDIYNAVENLWCKSGLTDQVRERAATVVIRPDSGDPLTVPVEIIELLMKHEGYTINSKGYRVLPDHIRVIQGDGITIESIPKIIENLRAAKISGSNLAFGMGGGLLQKVDRDTFKFAMKCSAVVVDGNTVNVFKDPVGDKSKKSKKGILALGRTRDGEYVTYNESMVRAYGMETTTIAIPEGGRLEVVRVDQPVYTSAGGLTKTAFTTFDRVRERAKLI